MAIWRFEPNTVHEGRAPLPLGPDDGLLTLSFLLPLCLSNPGRRVLQMFDGSGWIDGFLLLIPLRFEHLLFPPSILLPIVFRSLTNVGS